VKTEQLPAEVREVVDAQLEAESAGQVRS